MHSELDDLQETLLQGIKLSMQTSYTRRSPRAESLPFLEAAREGLQVFVERSGNSEKAWRLLSQAEECLLNYSRAIECLNMAIEIAGKRNKKDAKRLASLEESQNEWKRLPLSPGDLQRLGQFLVVSGADEEPNGRTLRFTSFWLNENGFDETDVIAALAERGAFTDFQVLFNVVGR